ncbi:MAG: metallophosphoesterase family protein, partial [Bradyrhizobium sp.]|nr:metallophosphoesterase family protein [Bradyrhizobium sp.]
MSKPTTTELLLLSGPRKSYASASLSLHSDSEHWRPFSFPHCPHHGRHASVRTKRRFDHQLAGAFPNAAKANGSSHGHALPAVPRTEAFMRFAAIADIHGNSDALAAVLADIASRGIDDVVNLGDHLSGPLEPVRTAEMLMACGFASIRGDQDRHMIDLHRAGDSSRRDVRALEQAHIDWLAAQPATLIYRDDVFLCHGA